MSSQATCIRDSSDTVDTKNEDITVLHTGLTVSSPIYFGHEIHSHFPSIIANHNVDKLVLISTRELIRLFGRPLMARLRSYGYTCELLEIDDTDNNKTFTSLDSLLGELLKRNVTKESILLALGGGSIGNIVGLAASLIYRGIRFVEIPTTLMGQSDSTLSNKQAVNGPLGKNQLGTFHAPIFIWTDTKYIATEHPRFTRAAIVEGVKNGLISDPEFLDRLVCQLNREGKYSPEELHSLCRMLIESKLPILKRDPTEVAYGMILEYGHTFGHAIEWLTKGEVVHGESVAIGMCIAAEASLRCGFLNREEVEYHDHLFGAVLGLSCSVPEGITTNDILKTIQTDNKRKGREIRYVILEQIGACCAGRGDFMIPIEEAILCESIESRMP